MLFLDSHKIKVRIQNLRNETKNPKLNPKLVVNHTVVSANAKTFMIIGKIY